jgi:hypothetical protein
MKANPVTKKIEVSVFKKALIAGSELIQTASSGLVPGLK